MGGRGSERVAQTIRARAAQVIEKQRDKMRRNLGSSIDGRDPEGVHDMRVASRRLRAALALFQPWLEKREAAQAAKSLRRLTRALGRVREFDVLRLRLEQLGSDASPESRIAIEIVDSRIARGRLRARSRMMKSFASIDLDSLDTRLRELAGAPPAWALEGGETSGRDAGVPWNTPGLDAPPDEPIRTLLEQLGPQVSDAARAIADTQVPAKSASREASEVLHDIRIRAKKLRYQLEIAAPHTGPRAAELIEMLKDLQDHLGDFHDDCVLDEVLAESISRQAARARPLLVHELRHLQTTRRVALRRDERACRTALDRLRAGGFAHAVAELFTRPADPGARAAPSGGRPAPPFGGTRSPRTRAPEPAAGVAESTAHDEPEPSASDPSRQERYAGEPIPKTSLVAPQGQEPKQAAAAAAAAPPAGGGFPRKT